MSQIIASPVIQELCPYTEAHNILEEVFARPFSFFLDSAGGRFAGARYSYLGIDPFLIFKCRGSNITVVQNGKKSLLRSDPFKVLKEFFSTYSIKPSDNSPPFLGGAVGYFGYDLGRLIEKLPDHCVDDIAIPDCCLGFYSSVIILDHRREKVWVAASGLPEKILSRRQKKAHQEIAAIRSLLAADQKKHPAPSPGGKQKNPVLLQANFDRSTYSTAILKAKEHITEGAIYQVNLSQRFSCATSISPSELYLRLRMVNPAPFSSFFNWEDHQVLSASPERFLRISREMVETRPIKGTRQRGSTREEDERLKQELPASSKDHAELVMIVDLERNDLGRVCRFGSVYPEKLYSLETHPTVHHLVATIRGELADGYDHIDCLRACFPGGSITGAPKIRAMEIIEELEPCRRKIYTGSLGYLGFNQETDLNILIRTILHVNGIYYFHVGGGIVADSDPDMEYEETLHKGKGLMRALGVDAGEKY